jgi:hypothetical protein
MSARAGIGRHSTAWLAHVIDLNNKKVRQSMWRSLMLTLRLVDRKEVLRPGYGLPPIATMMHKYEEDRSQKDDTSYVTCIQARALMISAARSAQKYTGPCVCPDGTCGIVAASTTLSPTVFFTVKSGSTTPHAAPRGEIDAVPTACHSLEEIRVGIN